MSHPEALEVLYWHDMNAIKQPERSDKSFKRKFDLVYKDPAPLNLSAQQIQDWIEEMRPEIKWQSGDEYVLSGVYVTLPEISRTFGKTLKDAVCLAAAKWKGENE